MSNLADPLKDLTTSQDDEHTDWETVLVRRFQQNGATRYEPGKADSTKAFMAHFKT